MAMQALPPVASIGSWVGTENTVGVTSALLSRHGKKIAFRRGCDGATAAVGDCTSRRTESDVMLGGSLL